MLFVIPDQIGLLLFAPLLSPSVHVLTAVYSSCQEVSINSLLVISTIITKGPDVTNRYAWIKIIDFTCFRVIFESIAALLYC